MALSEFMLNRQKLKQGQTVAVPTKKKAIKQQSDKQKEALKEYEKVRKDFLSKPENFRCVARIKCNGEAATEIHHAKGRIGDRLVSVKDFRPVCNKCHRWIEEHPEEAKALNLSKSRLKK